MVLGVTLMPRRPLGSHATAMRATAQGKDRVLLIEADTERRTLLATALAASGITVIAVASVAEIERWPEGEVVVTDGERFTPWWVQVGASHIVVLAETAEQGVEACQRGASAWVPRTCSPDLLIRALRRLGH
jgi:CheY-like chemotaxis protein